MKTSQTGSSNNTDIRKYLEEPPVSEEQSVVRSIALQPIPKEETLPELFEKTLGGLQSEGFFDQLKEARLRSRAKLQAIDQVWEANLDMLSEWLQSRSQIARTRFRAESEYTTAQCTDALQSGVESIRVRRLQTRLSNVLKMTEIVYAHIGQISVLSIPESEKERLIAPVRQKGEMEIARIMEDERG